MGEGEGQGLSIYSMIQNVCMLSTYLLYIAQCLMCVVQGTLTVYSKHKLDNNVSVGMNPDHYLLSQSSCKILIGREYIRLLVGQEIF